MLVARAGWLLARGEASPVQILLLAFGRKAAEEMDERIRERLHTEDITARTFHALALHIIQQGSKNYIPKTLPHARFMRWRCILFSRAAKKFR